MTESVKTCGPGLQEIISLVPVSYQQNLLIPDTCGFSVDIYLNNWRMFRCSSTFQSGCTGVLGHHTDRGPEAPVLWPPRSPDLYPINFYMWGSTTMRFTHTVDTSQQPWQRIQDAANEIRNTPGVFKRVRPRLDTIAKYLTNSSKRFRYEENVRE
jgi:hypothetical protein